jgi:hypothetical protein
MWRVATILATTLAFGCVAPAGSRHDEYLVVTEVVALDKRPTAGLSNLYPWEASSYVEADGTKGIVVSNSCGFVKVIYRGAPLAKVSQDLEDLKEELAVFQQMGEWCRVTDVVYERPTILRVKEWSHHLYVVDDAEVHRDGSGKLFVANRFFINDSGLANQMAPVSHTPEGDECFDKASLTPADLEDLRYFSEMEEVGDNLCMARGVYLEALRAN